jgi:S-formylglutathione hydrolase FrmB
MRRAALVLAALALLAPVQAEAATTVDTPGCVLAPKPQLGLTETARKQVSPRVLELTLQSKAMGGEQKVDVLLPAGYDPSGATRYPVLYLLHGSFGTYHDWVDQGAEKLVGDRQVIVVTPDDGPDGSYSDWYGTVAGTGDRAPAWESYHVGELVPFVDRAFPTTGRRFVAGLSSGGGGAMEYAAGHPGVFAAAGAFSGAVNTDLWRPVYPTESELLWLATLYPPFGPEGHCTWGDAYTQEVIWRDNEATYKAPNLRGANLFIASGDGTQGPYDANPTYDPVESTVDEMSKTLVTALDAEHIRHTDHFYGGGTHTWPYWLRDLQWFLDWLDPQLQGGPPAAPASFDDRSARERFSAWGWDFTTHRDVREFTYLEDVSAAGLTATGSGKLDVVTPPLYTPGARYEVGTRSVAADEAGRLRFTLDLGPSHQTQQSSFGDGDRRTWRRVSARIRAL